MKILPHYFSAAGPGAALAVAVDGEAPAVECYGLANIQQRTKITLDSVFDLASASKVFTATGIMLLVERGCLELTTPVRDFLPFIQDPKAARSITVRDLLWHTSGLPDYLESGMYADVDRVSPEYVAGQLPAWSRDVCPGATYTYSNTNYFVLARIIETISGLGFAEFFQSNVVDPFDLHRTFVLGAQRDTKRIAQGYRVAGYGLPLVEPSAEFSLETVGDGGVFSSLSDLIRWYSLFWNGEIVSERSLGLMQTPGKLDTGESFEYGLGLQVEQRAGGRTWCGHGGSWTSSTVLVGRSMTERTSVIVLSNEVMAPVERISQRALAIRRESNLPTFGQQ